MPYMPYALAPFDKGGNGGFSDVARTFRSAI